MKGDESKKGARRLDLLTLRFSAGVTFLVLVTLVPALYTFAHRHYQSQIDQLRETVHAQGAMLRLSLEHQMLENDRGLIHTLLEQYAAETSIRSIQILDRTGTIQFSNDRDLVGNRLEQGSETCQICHSQAPEDRKSSALIDLAGGETLRSVYPLRNREACHGCHDPENSINGVLIMDSSLSELKAAMSADLRWLAVTIAILAALMLGGISLAMRLAVVRRLWALEATARAISEGDLDQRAVVRGNDAVAWLASEFNSMAESVSDLLRKLRHQGRQIENLMNSVDDGVLVLDADYRVVAANEPFARRIGRSQAEVVGLKCCDLWESGSDCCSDETRSDCPAAQCFSTGRLHTALRTRKSLRGDDRMEEVFVSPVLDEHDQVTQVVEVWRDITDRKSREAHIAEFHRLASWGTLASGFAHEINTPLASVLFSADGIRRRINKGGDEPDLEQVKAAAELIRDEVMRCRDITQQFLRFSRGQSLSVDLLNLDQIVSAVVPLVRSQAKEAKVVVKVVEAEGKSPVVRANDGAVQQVLLNLLLNALQASPAGSEVEVACQQNGAGAQLRVRDQGAGIAPEMRKRLFEPFFSSRSGGTGLGLFVTHNLVHSWGGEIRVHSELGHGSTFEVTFPTRAEP
jgi:PAS domain S-box-containing protein